MASDPASSAPLQQTPLAERHRAAGGRMVPFAGYEMPVHYRLGILGEHNWTRENAGLFDVSHMGQCSLVGKDHAATARALETLVPADIQNLQPGRQRYTQFTTEDGGIIDDLMVARSAAARDDGRLMLVVNASRKDVDYAHMAERLLPLGVHLQRADERALIALQGPKAEAVMARHCPNAAVLGFMGASSAEFDGIECHVSRSGYTGEDGFEISVAAGRVGEVWDVLCADPHVKPIGLGARDSLRLEAGLCLYGHDIDETTSPVEAGLSWSIQKRRRLEGGFPGAPRVQRELAAGPARLRVGIRPEGRQPAREGTEIHARVIPGRGEAASPEPMTTDGRAKHSGAPAASSRPPVVMGSGLSPSASPGMTRVGTITSGGFGPTVNGPVAMGYVETAFAAPGTALTLLVRGKELAAAVAAMPFAPHRYKR